MRPSERRDVRQELRRRAESVALALHDSMAEVKRVPANDDGGKEVQAGYAEMLVLQCHLALSRNRPEPPRHDALAASSSRLETVTVTCMDEPHEELLAIADAMDRLVERGRQPDVREPLGRLEDAAKEIRKSSSGSWLGYHANVYYKGLRPRPPGAHFSQDSGLGDRYVSHTTGEWSELDPEAVEAAIREHAGNPNMEASARLREEAVGEFETQKLSVLSVFASVDSLDNFLTRLAGDLENLQILTSSDLINVWRPSGKFVSSDMLAIGQRIWTPPHVTVLARVVAVRQALDAVDRLGKLARQAGSHLARRQRQVRRSETVGTNVFIGHGRSPIWRELKDFIEDRLHLPVDEFNRVPVAGVTNIARLSEMMDAAAIAFLVMTGEDEQPGNRLHARMNVVHEAGLFQGRLGFTRAIVLLEEGCEEFSNIAGLGQIRFAQGNISAAFEQIREVLEREGLLDAASPP